LKRAAPLRLSPYCRNHWSRFVSCSAMRRMVSSYPVGSKRIGRKSKSFSRQMPSGHRRLAPTFARPVRMASALTIRNCWFNTSNRIWEQSQTKLGLRAYRHRRCSQSHCAGYSRTQASTTEVIACIVPRMSIRPSASRGGSIGSVISTQKLLPSGLRTTRNP
jgi:hypothetical protein